jgi:hypothetical protein
MEVGLHLDLGPGAGDAELDGAARALRDQLAATSVHRVALGADADAPAGAKGFGLAALGALVVQFVDAGGLGQVADVIAAWLQRDADRSVTLTDGTRTIELTGVRPSEQRAILEGWLAASAAGASADGASADGASADGASDGAADRG